MVCLTHRQNPGHVRPQPLCPPWRVKDNFKVPLSQHKPLNNPLICRSANNGRFSVKAFARLQTSLLAEQRRACEYEVQGYHAMQLHLKMLTSHSDSAGDVCCGHQHWGVGWAIGHACLPAGVQCASSKVLVGRLQRRGSLQIHMRKRRI